jgi:TolB-like protein/DNA-binding winged helix-turn-helix (wHTH) protein
MSSPVYQFGDFRLDCGAFELLRKGHSVRVERKPMELLILLASRPGQLVTRTEIAERLWSSEVFVDTEHGINTAVRKLRFLLQDDPENPQFIQTVTGLGYRFIAPVATLEPESPEGPDQAASEPPAASIASTSHRRLWIALAFSAVLIAVLAPFVVSRPLLARLLHQNPLPPINSLAVLPLDNLSGDPNQAYFADGMTDELITMLAKDSKLRITSRTSVMRFKGARRPLRDIAHELGVDGILEGSIERSSGQVHMTLQLIRADTDTHLWAESYDRATNDVVSLPGEAAREIARLLNSSVPSAGSTRYVDPAAHDAYLHGMYIWYSGSNERAGEYFRKAVEIQPDYALGLTGLSGYYGAGTFEGALDPRDALPKEEAAAAKAIALDDSLPEAHLTMGAAVYAGRWDWEWSEREIRRALELNPSYAEGWHLYAKLLGTRNRSDEAIAAQKRSTELDPFERPWAMAGILLVARQYDAALADANMRAETFPRDPILHWVKATCFRYKGMTRETVNEWIALYKDLGDAKSAAAVEREFNRGGIKSVIRWHIAINEKLANRRYVSPVYLAQLHAQLGEREATLALLEEGFRQHSPMLLWIQRYSEFDFLHSDPRYQSLVHRIGLPPAY